MESEFKMRSVKMAANIMLATAFLFPAGGQHAHAKTVNFKDPSLWRPADHCLVILLALVAFLIGLLLHPVRAQSSGPSENQNQWPGRTKPDRHLEPVISHSHRSL